MNDEIKAFLVNIKSNEEWKQIYDYITNLQHIEDLYNQSLKDYDKLQQRIEYLERSNNRREDTIMGLRDEIVDYEDYKSRCEKADEYVKEHTTSFGDVFIPASESWYLSDILNCRSDE